jgi:hypothetical protein
MDFNVGSKAITITSLGAFDSGQDGINGTIPVGIFDRTTSTLAGSTETTTLAEAYQRSTLVPG